MAQFGGRGVTNALESEIVRLLARAVLQAEFDRRSGVRFRITLREQRLRIEVDTVEVE
jgi:ATP-dependent Clp protease ATP-binding subunit ClpA